MSKLTPTQRTLRSLRQQGMIVDTCERWIPNPKHPGGGFRKDLFGFVDIIALGPYGIVGIQSCGQDFKSHYEKLTNSDTTEYVIEWLKAGAYLQLWGWRKIKRKRGGKAMVWSPRIKKITLETLKGGSYV